MWYYHRQVSEGQDDAVGDVEAESSGDDKEDNGERTEHQSRPVPIEHAEYGNGPNLQDGRDGTKKIETDLEYG